MKHILLISAIIFAALGCLPLVIAMIKIMFRPIFGDLENNTGKLMLLGGIVCLSLSIIELLIYYII
jgi:hypothetical protein